MSTNRIWLHATCRGISDGEGIIHQPSTQYTITSFGLLVPDTNYYRFECMASFNEEEVITKMHKVLCEVFSNTNIIAGWDIRNRLWPMIVNRFIKYKLPVPGPLVTNLHKRWSNVDFVEAHNIYTQTSSYEVRFLPALHDVLEFWLGEPFTPLEYINLVMDEGSLTNDDKANLAGYYHKTLSALEKVVNVYSGKDAL